MPERLPVRGLSEAGSTVMHQLSVSGERPAVPLRAFQSGMIQPDDLPELIAFAWTRDDSPASGASEAEWIEVFDRTGFFTHPPISTGRPASPAHGLPGLDSRAHEEDVMGSGPEHGRRNWRAPHVARTCLALRGHCAAACGTGLPGAPW